MFNIHIIFLGGDKMKFSDMAMVAMGSFLTLAYQKYNKPMMNAMKNAFDQSMVKMDKTLDDMM